MSLKTLAIVFGGKSPEHDVSKVSAYNIFKATDLQKYRPVLIGISRNGQWFEIPLTDFDPKTEIGTAGHRALVLDPFGASPFLYKDTMTGFTVDVLFPIAHGRYGEDGTLQGVLEHLNIPYIGPGVLGSAMGMDKDITKKIAGLAGVNVVPSVTVYKHESIKLEAIIQKLNLPVFVKPVNLGSAVGVKKASSADELKEALAFAFLYDSKVLIEKAITGREVETAVWGNELPQATRVGEIVIENDFYTYENKYENDKAKVVIPAENLSGKSMEIIGQYALTTYKALELSGLTRVDFFYVNDTEIYLNEVNTLPGFTNISMYPKLWEDRGVPFTELISKLADFAIDKFETKTQLSFER